MTKIISGLLIVLFLVFSGLSIVNGRELTGFSGGIAMRRLERYKANLKREVNV